MRKMILCLLLILSFGIFCGVTTLLAQDNADTTAIKQVIDNYLAGRAKSDLNLIMNQISHNYSRVDESGNTVDYAEFKSNVENAVKVMANGSVSNLEISDLTVQGDKATLSMAYNFKALNLNNNEEKSSKITSVVNLAKEGESWKIVQIQLQIQRLP